MVRRIKRHLYKGLKRPASSSSWRASQSGAALQGQRGCCGVTTAAGHKGLGISIAELTTSLNRESNYCTLSYALYYYLAGFKSWCALRCIARLLRQRGPAVLTSPSVRRVGTSYSTRLYRHYRHHRHFAGAETGGRREVPAVARRAAAL